MKLLLRNLSALRIAHSALFIALAPSAMMADTTYTWQKQSGAGTGGTDWTSWDDTANWSGGNVPASASDSIADLTAASGQYIAMPSSALALKSITMPSSTPAFPVLRGDSTITFHSTTSQKGPNRVFIYAPWALNVNGDNYGGPIWLQICGPLASVTGNPLWFGDNRFRFDLYATAALAADGVRSETAWPQPLRLYQNAGLTFIAPRGSSENIVSAWNQMEGSAFLSPVSSGGAVPTVGTSVSGAGIPDGTWLKRIFPDGSIELSSAVTSTLSSNPLTFAARTMDMAAAVKGNISRYVSGTSTSAIKIQKYREEDSFSVSFYRAVQTGANDTFKFTTEDGFIPGVAKVGGIVKASGAPFVPVVLENCHLIPNGDVFADASFRVPDAAHTARVSVVSGELRGFGTLDQLSGTFAKADAGELVICMTNAVSAYAGTLLVEAGTLSITNTSAYAARVVVKSGATLDAPNGLHVGTLEAEEGAIIKGGRFVIDSPDVSAFGSATFKGAYMLDATPSGRQLKITLVTGSMERAKLGKDFVSTFSADSLIRVDGSGEVEVLLVGGGGGGGHTFGGGGGGGGVVHRERVLLTNGWYGVAVGTGGHGASAKAALNTSGGDSMFYGITAFGGGAGGTWYTAKDVAGNTRGGSNRSHIGVGGGSGGGGGIMYPATGTDRSAPGGAGVEGQGHAGGRSCNTNGWPRVFGGGGGGAGEPGQDATFDFGTSLRSGGKGGDGIACSITGESVVYGGGGGGSGPSGSYASGAGAGGTGGGGKGTFATTARPGGDGTDGLGGGGGGGGSSSVDVDAGIDGRGGNGGRGVVILRYARPVEATTIVIR